MKHNKILVALLSAAMAFAPAVSIMPVTTYAAEAPAASSASVTASNLKALLEAGGTVTLNQNITYGSDTLITVRKDTTLDLNGHTITFTAKDRIIRVDSANGKLTIKGNGSLINTQGPVIWAQNGSTLRLENGTIESKNWGGLFITDSNFEMTGGRIQSSFNGDSAIHIGSNKNKKSSMMMSGGTIEGNFYGIHVCRNTTLNMTGGTIHTKWAGITGDVGKNIEAVEYGTNATINISGGTIVSTKDAAIYLPQKNASLTIKGKNTNITGLAGIVARAGSTHISDATVTSTGTEDVPIHDTPESSVPAAAVVFDSALNYLSAAESSKITISSGTFNSPAGIVPVQTKAGESDNNVRIEVNGGTFSAPLTANKNLKVSGSTAAPAPAAATGTFKDVPDSAYYAKAVDWAVKNKITSGKTASTFAPDAPCTRGQMAQFLWNLNGQPKAVSTRAFADVSDSNSFYNAIQWLASSGITSGTDATHFSPDATCTREQMAVFLWKMNDKQSAAVALPFTDLNSGSDAYRAVQWLLANKITSGVSSTSYGPKKACSRAQMVTFLYNMEQNVK